MNHTWLSSERRAFILHCIIRNHVEFLAMRVWLWVLATEKQILSVVVEEVDQITSTTTNGVDGWVEIIGNELLKALLFVAEVFERGNLHQLLNILVVLSVLFI